MEVLVEERLQDLEASGLPGWLPAMGEPVGLLLVLLEGLQQLAAVLAAGG